MLRGFAVGLGLGFWLLAGDACSEPLGNELPIELTLLARAERNELGSGYLALGLLELPLERVLGSAGSPLTKADNTGAKEEGGRVGVGKEPKPPAAKLTAGEANASEPSKSAEAENNHIKVVPPGPNGDPQVAASETLPNLPRFESNSGESAPPPRERSRRLLLLAQETVRRAREAQGYARSDQRLKELASRARTSAWLPVLGLRAQAQEGQALRLAPTESDPFRYTQSGETSALVEARATFRLDRLIFAREELAVERSRGNLGLSRAKLEERVLTTVFNWQRARLAAESDDVTDEERVLREVSVVELEARLDLLTGGWFSRIWREYE